MFNVTGTLTSGQKITGMIPAKTYTEATSIVEKSVPDGDALDKLILVEADAAALKVTKPRVRKAGEAAPAADKTAKRR